MSQSPMVPDGRIQKILAEFQALRGGRALDLDDILTLLRDDPSPAEKAKECNSS